MLNGQIAYIVYDMRNTNLSTKNEAVKELLKKLSSAVRQAQIVEGKDYKEIEVQVSKTVNQVAVKREVKKDSLDKILGMGVCSKDFQNFRKSALDKTEWQSRLARDIKNAISR